MIIFLPYVKKAVIYNPSHPADHNIHGGNESMVTMTAGLTGSQHCGGTQQPTFQTQSKVVVT
jgi:hypothetical protein